MGSRPAPQIGFSFEYLMWIFTRLSGLILFLLAFVGITGAFILGARTQMDAGALLRWTFFPNSYHVVNTDVIQVEEVWLNSFWNAVQLSIVFFGLTHGVNGLRVVIEDYLNRPWLRIMIRGLLLLIWLFFFIVAIYVVLTV
jgi:succinate dehydrogenase / fumarate reductase membrane anchor subunit